MPINIASYLAPRAGSRYFLMEDVYLKGSFRVALTLSERNNIDGSCLKQGMLVYVVEDGVTYQLGADLSTWSVFQTKGDKGDQGVAGANGSTIYSAVGEAEQALGVNGDYYIDTAAFELYKKVSGVWTDLGSLRGSAGAAGADGVDGMTIKSANAGPTAGDLGKTGDLFLNLTTLDLSKMVGGSWQVVASLQGTQGQRGSLWFFGIGVPAVDMGNTDDVYLDQNSADVYVKSSSGWAVALNIKGVTGDAGTNGTDGNKIYTGNADPAEDLGSYGDVFINALTFDVFQKNAAWFLVCNIKGSTGAAGKDGVDGNTILSGDTNPTGAQGKDDDVFVNYVSYELFRKEAGAWARKCSLKGADGADGADGLTLLSGAVNPSNALGRAGDVFVNLVSYELFKKTEGAWQSQGIIKGADGVNGTNGVDGLNGKDGASVLSGEGVPAEALGADGSVYVDFATYNLYAKSAGVWALKGSIKGADGADGKDGSNGADGADGANGVDGKSILSGEGAPEGAVGNDGDVYIDTASFSLYAKSVGAWASKGSFKGLNGADGTAGTDGVNGTAGADGVDGLSLLSGVAAPIEAQGNNGDLYLDFTTLDVYLKSNNAWAVKCNIKGAAGADGTNGADGTDGLNILSGTANPADAVGKDGELFLNLSTYELFKKAAGVWSSQGSIKGADGANGADGAGNVKWYDGTVDPVLGTPAAAVGDYYLNMTSGDVFNLSATEWTKKGNLKGSAGADYNPLTTTLNMPYDLSIFIPGNMMEANVIAYEFVAARKISLHQNLPGSIAKCRVAPTIEVCDYDIQVNGVSKGTLHFDSGSTTGTFTWATGLNLNAGDILNIVTPLFVDTALQDLSITLVGVAAAPNGILLP